MVLCCRPIGVDWSSNVCRPPTLTYVITHDTDNGRFVSVGALVHLDRRFASTAEQHRYTVVAAPHLVRGQALPDRLFGGTVSAATPGATARGTSARPSSCTSAARSAPATAGRSRLARDDRVIGLVKTVTLTRA